MFDIKSAQLLFAAAQELNLQPQWLTDYGLFSIQVHGKTEYVFYTASLLNTQLHSYLAKNKHATRTILGAHGFLNIPYALPQSLADATLFLKKHHTIIAKPTLGQHSEDVHVITTPAELSSLDLNKYLLERYIKGKEHRYLVLNGAVIAVHHKKYDTPINDIDTLQRISFEKADWNQERVQTAIAVASTLKLNLAAVDFMIDEQEQAFILEVNSAPGVSRFHYPHQGPAINFATLFLEASVAALALDKS